MCFERLWYRASLVPAHGAAWRAERRDCETRLRVLMSSSQLGHRKPSVVKALWDRCIGAGGPLDCPSSDPLELHSLSSSLLLMLLRRLDAQPLAGAAAAAASAKGLMRGCFLPEAVGFWHVRGTAVRAGVSHVGAGLASSTSSAASSARPRISRGSRLNPADWTHVDQAQAQTGCCSSDAKVRAGQGLVMKVVQYAVGEPEVQVERRRETTSRDVDPAQHRLPSMEAPDGTGQ